MRPDPAKPGEQTRDPARSYCFGQFRLDLNRQALFHDKKIVVLRPKSFGVLRYLLQNPGRVVSREELFDAVWPDLVVTDDSLTQCLIEIRKALGEENRELIQTMRGRGYLFDAEVRVEVTPKKRSVTVSIPPTAGLQLPSRWTVAAMLVLAVAVLITWLRIGMDDQGTGQSQTRWQPLPASVAVLPFADMSEQGDQQYLAEGIAEEILNLLAQSSGLNVIARTSSFSFNDSNADIATIAQRLNVAHVLEGSVRMDGDRVRVTAQLVEAPTGVHVWSETYDDRLIDVFALQDRIARAVAMVLQIELAQEIPPDSATMVRTPHPEAWETYLRGRLYYSRRSEGDVLRAQQSFEEALAIDPQFADAWVSLSATLRLRQGSDWLPPEERLSREEAMPRMRDTLEKALAINPNHPEALWRFGGLIWKEDPERALELLYRAAKLGHNDAMVQAMMGGFLDQTGYPDKALPYLTRAAMLDPLSASHQAILGNNLYRNGRLAEAEGAIMRSAELRPTRSEWQWTRIAWIHIVWNDLESAADIVKDLPASRERDMTLAMLEHLRGRSDAANEAAERLLALPDEESASLLAQVYATFGNSDEAFRWLGIATTNIENSALGYKARVEITRLRYSPFLAPLQKDQRWDQWWSVAENMLLDERDHELIDFLVMFQERHPELYDSTATIIAQSN